MQQDNSITKCREMDLTEVRSEEPLLQQEQRSRTSCFHWLSICSFVLLLGATIFLALLHFQIFPAENKDDYQSNQMPEVLQIKNYLESVPQTQAMAGKRAAAHLLGKRVKNGIKWQGVSTNAFSEGSIKLVKNSLEIGVTGLYFVYTQVVFTGPQCPKNPEFDHSVIRKSTSADEPMSMLKSSKTVCDVKSNSFWTQPIYQGGLFNLEKGDLLYTNTSDVEFLDSNDGQVYFGILAV